MRLVQEGLSFMTSIDCMLQDPFADTGSETFDLSNCGPKLPDRQNTATDNMGINGVHNGVSALASTLQFSMNPISFPDTIHNAQTTVSEETRPYDGSTELDWLFGCLAEVDTGFLPGKVD